MKKRTTQVAALPIRISDDGEINVLLVSSRETRRWVIPKGLAVEKNGRCQGSRTRGSRGSGRYRQGLSETRRLLSISKSAPGKAPPWDIIEHAEIFEVSTANGLTIAFVYFEDENPTRRFEMGRLTKDEARRVTANGAMGRSSEKGRLDGGGR